MFDIKNMVPGESAPKIETRTVKSLEMLTEAGSYIFKVEDCRETDSRHNLDGSEKENLPEYADATPQMFVLLRDVESGKVHFHKYALAAFVKSKDLTEKDVLEVKKKFQVETDERDNYLLIRDKKAKKDDPWYRVPAQKGEGYEAMVDILSKFTTAIGVPEGSSEQDIIGHVKENKCHFEAKLTSEEYTSNEGELKTRLKLSSNCKAVSAEEVELVTEQVDDFE